VPFISRFLKEEIYLLPDGFVIDEFIIHTELELRRNRNKK